MIECDAEAAVDWARKAVEENIDPIKAIDALMEEITQIGDGLGRGSRQEIAILWDIPDDTSTIQDLRNEGKSFCLQAPRSARGYMHLKLLIHRSG